ncbi:MurR/RpiR family transcriptional regulator [Hominifimenecus sp. rT4P-3]|uniref:MurR/RpiR family transcriptional regulator n=1 Tax=Hominifimenecus sp. rT4P-3 TaxID=3242979 RepID=UPI003DA44A1D
MPGSVNADLEFIQRIRTRHSMLSGATQRIADYLLESDLDQIKDINVNSLAKITGTSASTVTRFCRILGYEGFSEFKFYINKEILSGYSKTEKLKKGDSASEVKQKVAELIVQSISMTELKIDNDQLEKAITAIQNAETVLFLGMGASSGIAETAAGMMLCSGINSFSSSDPLTQLRKLAYLKKGDVVVGLNSQGKSRDIYDVFAMAKKKGIICISIATFSDSPLVSVADIFLETAIKEEKFMQLSMAMICQLFVIECLQIGLVMGNSENSKEKIQEMLQYTSMKYLK